MGFSKCNYHELIKIIRDYGYDVGHNCPEVEINQELIKEAYEEGRKEGIADWMKLAEQIDYDDLQD